MLTIWEKGAELKLFRKMSLNKCLQCFKNCNLGPVILNNESVASDPISMKHPRSVTILYGLLCNLRCSMCPQDHNNNLILNGDILRKNINWDQVDEIELQGGEVLAMKDAKKMYLWLTQQMGKKVNLITNGMLINDEWAEHLVQGSGKIRISVNAASKKTHELVNKGSNYEKVIDNIRKLIHLKHHHNLDVKIQYKFTITPENVREIADAIEVADNLGCDKINYGYDRTVPAILRGDKELREHLKHTIDRLVGSNLKIEVERCRLRLLGLA
jgi:MoaA/NifB/PqqE/SkfB family radical SAM enzyme